MVNLSVGGGGYENGYPLMLTLLSVGVCKNGQFTWGSENATFSWGLENAFLYGMDIFETHMHQNCISEIPTYKNIIFETPITKLAFSRSPHPQK